MGPRADADDRVLLGRYAHGRDQAAFAAVVRRHVDMVYSAAVRRVGDRHLAEDVTQAVFVILARRAKSVAASHRPVGLWLLNTVRYAAANALRIEARRRRREHLTPAEKSANLAGACSGNPTDVLIWQEAAARLDDAVLKLPAADQRAVVLRFYEDRPIREIAAALEVSEAAAKQRVSRAVEKLRHRLDRRGAGGLAGMTAVGWESLLASHVVRTAPARLGDAACAAALTGAAGGAAGILIAKGAIHMMTLAKTKLVSTVVAVCVVIGVGGAVLVNHTSAQEGRTPAVAPQPAASGGAAAALVAATAQAAAKAKDDDDGGGGQFSVKNMPPVVVSTVPQAGATDVDPAITEIKVTFSKNMMDGNWAFAQLSKEYFPERAGKIRYLDDKRTCVMPVKLQPGRTYVIALNKPPYDSFMDTGRRKALEYLLVFETKK